MITVTTTTARLHNITKIEVAHPHFLLYFLVFILLSVRVYSIVQFCSAGREQREDMNRERQEGSRLASGEMREKEGKNHHISLLLRICGFQCIHVCLFCLGVFPVRLSFYSFIFFSVRLNDWISASV